MTAAARDLSTMLKPRSIALVGATERSNWSKQTFANLTGGTYDGEVHLVARRGGTVHGRTAATSCAGLGAKWISVLSWCPRPRSRRQWQILARRARAMR